MSTQLPSNISKEIKQKVYELANDVKYLSMSRTDSGVFLNSLVENPEVGGVIAQYVKRHRVRHYIKDAILNRYSKDKTNEAKPSDYRGIIKSRYGFDCEVSHAENKITLYRSTSVENNYVVIAEGTVLKWETALRKALLFTSGKPFSTNAEKIYILLMLFTQNKRLAPSDKSHLEKALKYINAEAYFFGEQ